MYLHTCIRDARKCTLQPQKGMYRVPAFNLVQWVVLPSRVVCLNRHTCNTSRKRYAPPPLEYVLPQASKQALFRKVSQEPVVDGHVVDKVQGGIVDKVRGSRRLENM